MSTEVAAARAKVTEDLADPAAAQFRHVRAFQMKAGAATLFCGEINAKNLLGAYTGFRPFLAGADVGVIAGQSDEPGIAEVETRMVLIGCSATPYRRYGEVRF